MKKVIEQSIHIKDKFLQYQGKQIGNFESFLQKQNEKKNKITQKLLDIQAKLERAKPHKQNRFQEKIASLEAELQQLQKKEQIAKDFHLVYEGLSKQLLLCQNPNFEKISQREKDDNYQIVCQIKRQAYNVRKQVYKQKHIYPLTKMMEQCDQLINMYLKAGVCLNVIQPEILNLGNDDQFGRQDKQEIRQQKQENKNLEQDVRQYSNSDWKQVQEYPPQKIPLKGYKEYEKQQAQLAIQQKPQHQQKVLQQQQQVQNYPESEILDMQSQFVKVSISQQEKKKEQKEEQTQNSDDKHLCQICFEHPKSYVTVPCGHFVYCSTCKDLIQKQCLICRAEVSQILKIFQ